MGLRSIRALKYGVRFASLVLLSFCSELAAQPREISADGAEYELNIAAGEDLAAGLELFFISPGSVSLAVGLAIDGPAGLVVEVSSALLEEYKGRGARPGSATSISSVTGYEPSSVISQGVSRSKLSNGLIIDPKSQGGVVQALYHIHKDACLPDSTTRYVSRLKLSFEKVSSDLKAAGFKLRFALREYRFSGATVASIKPASDGKYFGEPILLMGTIQFGDEYVRVLRRHANRVRSRRVLPVVKYVTHRGHSLSLARLQGVLRGGRATFELTNGGFVYGVCFALDRRRQVANGYKV